MYIESVKLENFRNYTSCYVELEKNLNIFKGANAQGKTNFLESIYISSIGKSPKTTKDKDVIKWGESRAKIDVKVKKSFYEEDLSLVLSNDQKKTIKINGIAIKKIGDLIGEMPVVYFAPDEIGLIKDGPAFRRKFMDIDISQINKNYFYLLCRYEKVLNERNKLLKQTRSFEALKDTIDIWDTQLADISSKIIYCRLDFIDKIKDHTNAIHKAITSDKEDLIISYQGLKQKSIEVLKEKIYALYKEKLKSDFDLGYTSIGPHRDDIEIKINGIDIRNFGSQGQQRLATLSIKIAELKLFEELTHEKPILLLDDVLSELDEKRCKNFLKQIEEYQTILTTTKFNRKLNENSKIFNVSNATIS